MPDSSPYEPPVGMPKHRRVYLDGHESYPGSVFTVTDHLLCDVREELYELRQLFAAWVDVQEERRRGG